MYVTWEFFLVQVAELQPQLDCDCVGGSHLCFTLSEGFGLNIDYWHNTNNLLHILKFLRSPETKLFTLTGRHATECVDRTILDALIFDGFLVFLNYIGRKLGDLNKGIVTMPHSLDKVLLENLAGLHDLGGHTLRALALGMQTLQLLNHLGNQGHHLRCHLSNVIHRLSENWIISFFQFEHLGKDQECWLQVHLTSFFSCKLWDNFVDFFVA